MLICNVIYGLMRLIIEDISIDPLQYGYILNKEDDLVPLIIYDTLKKH